jgi:hypothetical protein
MKNPPLVSDGPSRSALTVLSEPFHVFQAVQETCSQYMLQPNINGRLAILSEIPNKHGFIRGAIEWGTSVPYMVSCKQIEEFSIREVKQQPPGVAEVFNVLSSELYRIWTSSVKAHHEREGKLTISSEIVIQTEYQRDRNRFRIFITTIKTQRLFAYPLT